MSRQIGKVAVVALAVILLGTQAVTALGGIGTYGISRTSFDPLLSAEQTVRALESTVVSTSADATRVVERVEALAARIATLEAELRDAGAERSAAQQRLVKDTGAAGERIATWRPVGRPSLQELTEPLEAVATAMHAGDDHRGALLAAIGDLAVRATEVRQLRAEAGAVAFELGGVRAALVSQAAVAARSGWVGAGEAEVVLADIRRLAGRVDSATMSLRQNQARILALSVALDEERLAIREDIRGARAAESDLLSSAVTAEDTIRALVVSMLGDSQWGPFAEGVFQVCPVDMPNAYYDNWLAPRYGGGFHLHQGIDIFAATGTPIRAPFPGTAVAVPNSLGGMAVSVYGAEGYVYNAHLSEYGQLGEVLTGDVIGYVGMTGNASGPHNHFEWHPGDGDAVNPFEALNAACRPL